MTYDMSINIYIYAYRVLFCFKFSHPPGFCWMQPAWERERERERFVMMQFPSVFFVAGYHIGGSFQEWGLETHSFYELCPRRPNFYKLLGAFLRNYSNMNLQTVWIYVFWWIWFGEQVKCSGLVATASLLESICHNLFLLKVAKVLDPEAEKKSGHLRWHHWHH